MRSAGRRRRKAIQTSLRQGLGTLRRTLGNLNDLMFSSSSLASGVSKDLREYMYGDSGATPQSLRRIVALLASDEVQRTIQGTAQGLIAAFFAARQRTPARLATEGDKSDAQGDGGDAVGAASQADALRETVSMVLDKVHARALQQAPSSCLPPDCTRPHRPVPHYRAES